MFLTESQKHYYTAMKKLGRKKPQKVIKRPINNFLAMFYDLSNSRRYVNMHVLNSILITNVRLSPNASFEIAIFVLIFLNMLTMGIEHYDQPHAVFFILEVSNAFFTTVFGLGKCWRTDKRMFFSNCISCLYRYSFYTICERVGWFYRISTND